MAKSKSFFGLRRGSTKSHTYQIDAYGQQVTKDRVVEVKNPRTEAQMLQRMFMATVSAGYSGLRAICDHSFEGVTYGAPSMAKFTKINLNKVTHEMADGDANFGFNKYQVRDLLPGAYQVSKGSLNAPVFVGQGADDADTADVVLSSSGTNIKFKLPAIAVGQTFSQALASLGASVGDMLTIVGIGKVGTSYRLVYVRIKFIAGGSTVLTAANVHSFLEVESNFNLTEVYGAEDPFTVQLPATISADVSAIGDEMVVEGAWGVIRSSQEDGKWKRSDCVLDVRYYRTGISPDADTALATYPVGSSYILNGGE